MMVATLANVDNLNSLIIIVILSFSGNKWMGSFITVIILSLGLVTLGGTHTQLYQLEMTFLQIFAVLVLIIGRLQQDHAPQDQHNCNHDQQDEEHRRCLFYFVYLVSCAQFYEFFSHQLNILCASYELI